MATPCEGHFPKACTSDGQRTEVTVTGTGHRHMDTQAEQAVWVEEPTAFPSAFPSARTAARALISPCVVSGVVPETSGTAVTHVSGMVPEISGRTMIPHVFPWLEPVLVSRPVALPAAFPPVALPAASLRAAQCAALFPATFLSPCPPIALLGSPETG